MRVSGHYRDVLTSLVRQAAELDSVEALGEVEAGAELNALNKFCKLVSVDTFLIEWECEWLSNSDSDLFNVW